MTKTIQQRARDILADKPDHIIDKVMYSVGRKHVTAISMYEGAKTEHIPVSDFVAGHRYGEQDQYGNYLYR